MKRTSEPKLNQSLKGEGQQKVNPYTLRRLRQKIATIKRPRVRASAVAGFLFMPQFRSCFVGISHLYPVLVRMVAVLFAECTLISPAHPALSLKVSDDKATYSFKRLVGDAWFTLKTSRATAFQWSMFGAVVLMVTTLLTALGAFFGRIMLGVGTVAQAQLFNAFQNPNGPYGPPAGTNPHDWTSINQGTANISLPGGGMLFDQRVYAPASGTNNGISADYALMVLDKVLRQSMVDTPNGGLMQNALRDLMVIYNSGMLVIACIMIGWMVMSLIIDTAKTGTVGGGRHNMVWLPIRILFALGIMFPLGSVGFSGGQYMVVKLAEWGSNFGTRGWTTYVSAVIGNQTLLAPYSVKNAASIATSITKIMVCQVAYNTYLRQRTGLLDPKQIITRYRDDPGTAGKPFLTNRYTNTTNPNVCGTINYGSNLVPDDQSAQMDWDPSPAASTTPFTVSTNRNSQPDNVYKNTALATAAKAYRTAMRNAVESQVEEVIGGEGNGAARMGPAILAARNFACQFVANRFQTGDASSTAGNPVADIAVADAAGNPAAVPECAGMAKTAADPTTAVLTGIQTGLMGAMMTAFTTTGQPALQTYIGTGTGAPVTAASILPAPPCCSPMLTELSIRGWGGMGTWYQDIVTLNNIMLSVREPFVTIEAGGAWAGEAGTVMEDQCASGQTPGEPCKFPEIAANVLGMMSEYDRWWGVSSMVTDPGKGPVAAASQSNTEMGAVPGTMAEGAIASATSQSKGDSGVLDTFARLLFPRSTDTFIFKAVDLQATNTYPLTQLADTGHSMLGIGVALWGTISLFQAVSTIESPWFSVGKGLAFSAVMQMLASLGSIMIFTGILVSFYLPALPYLRVAFAVLTWITAVFEAVVMVPVAALTHLSTTGPGLMGQHGRIAWVMWFSIFMRPILVVFGFIGGMLIFNTFAVYFHTTFSQGAGIIINQPGLMSAYIAKICYSVVYLATLYSVANSTFKLMDLLPNQMMRWMGEWGSRGGIAQSMDPGPLGRGLGFAGAQFMDQMKQAVPGKYIQAFKDNSIDWNGNRLQGSLDRAAMLSSPASALGGNALKQKAADTMLTLSRLSGKEREQYQSLSQRDKDRFLVHKFMSQENKRYKRFSFEQGIGSGIMARLGGGMYRDNFQALDGIGGVGAGQVAGAVVADKALEKALSAGNSTHTSDWDDLSEAQRDNVRKKIESQMSGADALSYQKMSSDDRNSFVQSFYLIDPLAFAPGVGKSGVDRMTDFLMHPDKLKANAGYLAEAALLMKQMTRAEKDQATRRYLKWEKDNGRPSDPSLLLGQLGGMSVSDRMLDSALNLGSKTALHMVDGFQSNRLVTAAMKQLNFVTHVKEDIRRISGKEQLDVGLYEMTAVERGFYDKATKEQKQAILQLKYDEYEARKEYQEGKGFFLLPGSGKLEKIQARNEILMGMIMKDAAGGGLLLDNHKRAIAMMSGAEQVAHAGLRDAKERQDFENLMLKRRLLSKKFYKKDISAAEYYRAMTALKREIRRKYNIGF